MSESLQECHDDHCITCGDVAESMRVLDVDAARALALCGRVEVGDRLLVHAGTAIARAEESPA